MFWLQGRRRSSGPSNAQRQKLETRVRLRFQLASSDPMIAIIGAVAQLTDAGLDEQDATETVLRIMRESKPDGSP